MEIKIKKDGISAWSEMFNTELIGLNLADTLYVIGSIVYFDIGEYLKYFSQKGKVLFASEWSIGLLGYHWEISENGKPALTSDSHPDEMKKYLATLREKQIVRLHISKSGILRAQAD